MTIRKTRRAFLIGGSVLALGAAGGLVWGLHAPEDYNTSWVLGDAEGKRVLVAYASKSGSTMEIARRIGEEMARAGWTADVAPAEEIGTLAGYDAVVLGSGIRIGKPYKPARDFAGRFADVLAALPTAAFAVSLSAASPDEEAMAEGQRYAQDLGALVDARLTASMPGVNNPETLAPIIKMAFQQVDASDPSLPPAGDYRDWDLVQSWAAALALGLA